jgi:hypothetical protein
VGGADLPKQIVNATATVRDYVAIDKALVDQLAFYRNNARLINAEERDARAAERAETAESRIAELHALDKRRSEILLKLTEDQLNGERERNSGTDGTGTPSGDPTLPDNNRTY